jgi:tetratricopeptide (TPR) repeat protein
LRYVRTNVAKDTKNYQVPWNSSSLTGEFAFNQKSGTTTSPSVISPPIPKPRPTQVTPKPQPSPSPQLTAKTFNNRGISKYSMEYLQGAIWDYDKALKLKPDDAEAYYNRGLSYKYFGYSPNAINDFLQAKKLYQQQNNQTGYQASLDRLKELGVSN